MEPSFVASVAAGFIVSEQLRPRAHKTSLGPPVSSIPPTFDPNKKDSHAAILPKGPVLYAVITDRNSLIEPTTIQYGPPIVQNGMGAALDSNPSPAKPALVPLDMNSVSLNVECHISTAFATVQGVWTLNLLKKETACDCLLAVPMHRQGTVSGVEIDLGDGRLYATLVIPKEEAASYGAKGSTDTGAENPGTYNPELFRLFCPQVLAGSRLSIKITWFQTMEFMEGYYHVKIPFTFPDHVLPEGKTVVNVTKVLCTINTGTNLPVEIGGGLPESLKETSRTLGRVTLTADSSDSPDGWRNGDFNAAYKVWADGILPSLLVQDPNPGQLDPRGVFCLSVSPPDPKTVQGFQRAVIFLLDRSGSMSGKPMNDAKDALRFGLNHLQPVDLFNIIAFDHEQICFSPQLLSASQEVTKQAQEWIYSSVDARGGTDILTPLQQALQMLQNIQGYVPYIFLITDGAVSNERGICREIQSTIQLTGQAAPRLSTFGIGHYCNYYFLKMLALIGRGLSDVAFNSDKMRDQMERMLVAASTPLLTNIVLNIDVPGGCEIYPYPIPDLFCTSPLIVSGRFSGRFPDSIKIVGILPDRSQLELEVQKQKAEQIPLDKVFAKQQLDLITAQAWLTEDLRLQHQAVNLSVQTGIPCEYTRMVSFETTKQQHEQIKNDIKKGKKVDVRKYAGKAAKIAIVGGLIIGFGSIAATAANLAVADLAFGGDDFFGALGDVDAFLCCDCGDCDCGLCEACGDIDCGEVFDCLGDCLCSVAGAFLEYELVGGREEGKLAFSTLSDESETWQKRGSPLSQVIATIARSLNDPELGLDPVSLIDVLREKPHLYI
ncbi:hypothetical protein R1sor_015018 [Riccia sorocarpa]|uniref:VWFA domain-containing protein n=1 Tax=Riccia sorocarpa TaxID=122646 RepID=A0ABD3HDX7_9MARC